MSEFTQFDGPEAPPGRTVTAAGASYTTADTELGQTPTELGQTRRLDAGFHPPSNISCGATVPGGNEWSSW